MANISSLEELNKLRGITTSEPAISPVIQQTQQLGIKPTAADTTISSIDQLNLLRNKGVDTEDEYMFDPTDTLKKNDLKTGQRAKIIRDHMIDRAGVDYEVAAGKSDDEVVEDFIDNMR
jgi:hypothetical protein